MALDSLQGQYIRMKQDVENMLVINRRLDERIQQLEVQKDAETVFNSVSVLEPARIATDPSYPRRKRTMAVALAAGMLLGAGLALLRDRMDGRMRSVEEIQTVIGLPILGVVPAMSGRRTAKPAVQ